METFTATSDQQPASFSGGKGKGAGVICQVEKEGFWEWGKMVLTSFKLCFIQCLFYIPMPQKLHHGIKEGFPDFALMASPANAKARPTAS